MTKTRPLVCILGNASQSVKHFVLNGHFDRLDGGNSEANGWTSEAPSLLKINTLDAHRHRIAQDSGSTFLVREGAELALKLCPTDIDETWTVAINRLASKRPSPNETVAIVLRL